MTTDDLLRHNRNTTLTRMLPSSFDWVIDVSISGPRMQSKFKENQKKILIEHPMKRAACSISGLEYQFLLSIILTMTYQYGVSHFRVILVHIDNLRLHHCWKNWMLFFDAGIWLGKYSSLTPNIELVDLSPLIGNLAPTFWRIHLNEIEK